MARMDRWHWERRRGVKGSRGKAGGRHRSTRSLACELLEDRRVLASVVVTNVTDQVNGVTSSLAALFANDGGDGISLREAIQAANATPGEDRITFAEALSGQSVRLVNGQLQSTGSLTIDATALSEPLTIDAQRQSRVIEKRDYLKLAGLTLTGGAVTGVGGAIRSTQGALVIEDSRIAGNTATGSGGGVHSTFDVEITRSTIANNATTGNQAPGGAVFAQAFIRVTDSTIHGNSTAGYSSGGGGLASGSAGISLNRSTVSGNWTSGTSSSGGGIFMSSGYDGVRLTQSTVSGNHTAGILSHGGGVSSGVAVTLHQSTVTNNAVRSITSRAGGIWHDNYAAQIEGSIVAGNSAVYGPADLVGNGVALAATRSLFGEGVVVASGGDNLFSNNPQLGPLQENGGATATHEPLPGSPAINAGDPLYLIDPFDFDQRGEPFTRVFAGQIDIGSVEVRNPVLLVDNAVDEDDGVFSLGELSLREAIWLANQQYDHNVIEFAPSLSGQTISLGGTQIEISDTLSIDATALAEPITIDAGHQSRIFSVVATTGDFDFKGLTLARGRTTSTGGAGGAIFSNTTGLLTLERSEIRDSETRGHEAVGGAISASGDVDLIQSRLSGNQTFGQSAHGGALRSATGTVRLESSEVIGNTAHGYAVRGGGISAGTGDVVITSSTVSGNRTLQTLARGGGVYAGGDVTLTDSLVSGNQAGGSGTYFARGGGVSAMGSITVTRSVVSENAAIGRRLDVQGGGIEAPTVTVIESTLSGNRAVGADSRGAGISGANIYLVDSTISGNIIEGEGGFGAGVYSHSVRYWVGNVATYTSSQVSVRKSTLSGNHALGDASRGGAIYHKSQSTGDVTITQSTITANSADGGGGVWNAAGTLVITGSIVAGNSAAVGGVDIGRANESPLMVSHSLIGDNDQTPLVEAAVPDALGNLIGDSSQGGAIDPLLAPLAFNGGPTATHDLLPDSPARDSGDPSLEYDPLAFDQRGAPFPRVHGGRIDIGSVESNDYLVNEIGDEDDGDPDNGTTTLREAINLANANPGFDRIVFVAGLSGLSIALAGGELVISEELQIDASHLASPITIDARGLSRVFNVTATTGDVELNSLTLTGGRTVGDDAGDGFGEAISSIHSGGAVRSLTTGELKLGRVVIEGARTEGLYAAGGAIYSVGSVTLTGSQVSNASTRGDVARGGAISARGGVSLVDSEIEQNHTHGNGSDGGAIYALGDVSITASRVRDNGALGWYASGGAIYTQGDVSVTGGEVSGNTTSGLASTNGGAIFAPAGRVDVLRSTLAGNHASGAGSRGGAVYAGHGASVTLSTISGNSVAEGGGGGVFSAGAIEVFQSTIVENHGGQYGVGGGLLTANQPITLSSSIVASNTAGNGSADLNAGTAGVNATFSLIGDGDGAGLSEASTPNAAGNLIGSSSGRGVIDPGLSPLADNGGFNPTHALTITSPARNGGDPSETGAAETYDQRGEPYARVIAGRIDIGSFELRTIVVDNVSDIDDGNYGRGKVTLREAVSLANATPGQDTIRFDFGTATKRIEMGGVELDVAESLVIDARDSPIYVDANGLSRVIHFTAGSGDLSLLGLKVMNGRTTGEGQSGGAIHFASTGLLALTNVLVDSSKTEGDAAAGGAIWSRGSVQIIGGEYIANQTRGAYSPGGAVWSEQSITVLDAEISRNVTYSASSQGGAIATPGDILVSGSELEINWTLSDHSPGGAIHAGGSVTVEASFFDGNNTKGLLSSGGAIASESLVAIVGGQVRYSSTAGAGSTGGAIYSSGVASFQNVSVYNNTTTGEDASGGAVAAAEVNSSHSRFASNSTRGEGAGGGAIYSEGDATLDSDIINFNGVHGDFAVGGGLFALSDVWITSSTFDRNSTSGKYGHGGAVFTEGNVVADTSHFSANITLGDGPANGGAIATQGWVDILRSTLSQNGVESKSSRGGAVFAGEGGVLTLSTLSGNTATEGTGGGMYASGPVTINGSTIFGNEAGAYGTGGGVATDNRAVTIRGSVIAGNTAGAGRPDLDPGTAALLVEYSLVGDAAGLSLHESPTPDSLGNVIGNSKGGGAIDPLLSPLVDNGGPTPTHAPLFGSPLIDAGDPDILPQSDQFDQRGEGHQRVFGPRIDIGAVEVAQLVVNSMRDVQDLDLEAGETTLREAIRIANEAGVAYITFDTFTFSTPQQIVLAGPLVIDDGRTSIFGPGAEFVTISAGNGADGIFNTGDGFRVLAVDDGSKDKWLDISISGLTFTGGDIAAVDSTQSNGGGIRNAERLTLVDSVVRRNASAGQGGGVFNSGELELTRVTIADNAAALSGGGLANTKTLDVRRSVISGNVSQQAGGGLQNRGPASIAESIVSHNRAPVGGGISNSGASLDVARSTIHDNHAASVGGGVSGPANFLASTISGNSAGVRGGGIYAVLYSDNYLEQSTITGNTAPKGSAISLHTYPDGGSPFLVATVILNNSIVQGVVDQRVSGNYNLFSSAAASVSGTGNLRGVNPMLGPLADNGGATPTHLPSPSSQAVNRGNPAALFDPNAFDQRGAGYFRVVGGRSDIGAVEVQATPPALPGDYNNDGRVDAVDYTVWRDNLDTIASAPYAAADGDGDGFVDAGDYEVWRSHYGQTVTALAAASTAIVSPSDSKKSDRVEAISTIVTTSVSSMVAEPAPTPAKLVTYAAIDEAFAQQTVSMSRSRERVVARNPVRPPLRDPSFNDDLLFWNALAQQRPASGAAPWMEYSRIDRDNTASDLDDDAILVSLGNSL